MIIWFKEKRKEKKNTTDRKIDKIKLPQDVNISSVRKKWKGGSRTGLSMNTGIREHGV